MFSGKRPTGSAARRVAAVLATVGVGLAGALYAITGSVPSASASALTGPALLTYPLTMDTTIVHHDDQGEQALVNVDLTLQAGESRRLIGMVHATMTTNPNTQKNMDDTATIRCYDAAWVQTGSAATAEVGVLRGETRVLRPTLLLTATGAGVYHCHLAAETGTADAQLTVHKSLTFLQVSAGDEAGAHMWQNPPCDSEGLLATCTYLGERDGPTQRLLLFDDGTAPSVFTAAAGATTIDATANVELTECGKTASCGGLKHNGDNGTVSSHLEVVQLGASGTSTCNVTVSSERTDVIGQLNHHYNIAYGLTNVPVLATCGGSRNFRVRVAMRWVSGNSVKIDGTRDDPLAQTNGVVVNSHYVPSGPPLVNRPVPSAGGAMTLSWIDESANEDGFGVFRTRSDGTILSEVVDLPTPNKAGVGEAVTIVDSTPVADPTQRCYRVTAYDYNGTAGIGGTSDTVCA